MQGDCGRQHIGIIGLVNDILIKWIFDNQRRCDLIEAIAAAALPVLRLGDAARIVSGNHFIQTNLTMSVGMAAHFHTDPASAHFLRNGSSGAGTKEGIKNQIAGIGGNMDDALNKLFGFRSGKNIIFAENRHNLFL